MRWQSALAIYILVWVMSAFFVMPFGVRNAAELGAELVPGQEQGAPANFNGRKIVLHTTIVATMAFALFYLNYEQGWISLKSLGLRPYTKVH